MLLSNVMLVPGMNTFIEPKHTLQVATPTPMLLEQRNTVIALSSRSLSKDKRLSNLTYRRKGVFRGFFRPLHYEADQVKRRILKTVYYE